MERLEYLAHSRSDAFARRLREAREMLSAHTGHTVCVSWGKDSVVLYDLARDRAAVHGRYRDEERFPDLDGVRDGFGPQGDYREASVPGAWDMFERAGGFFFVPETDRQKEASRWYHRRWDENMLDATGPKVALGIRQEESRVRRILLATRGDHYRTKERDVILPLARWTGRDIWAYIVSRELPYAKIYDLSFGERDRARSDFTFGAGAASEAIWRHGAWEDWKLAYPEQLRVWMERFPEMAEFV